MQRNKNGKRCSASGNGKMQRTRDEKRQCNKTVKDVIQPELSVFYRDILRKQYIASFGNIRKYRDTRGYHDIFTIFFYA